MSHYLNLDYNLYHMPTITLRPWTIEDKAQLAKIANNKNIAKNLTNYFPHPYVEKDAEEYIQFCESYDPLTIFAIDLKGVAIGSIGFKLQEDIFIKNLELGYWLGEAYWGKGYMTEAIRLIVAYGFKTFDIQRIYARPFGTNLGSQNVLLKNGFIEEAHFKNTIFKDGVFLDEIVYGIRR